MLRSSRDQRVRRWTVNGRFLSQRITGVQRYAREVLAALDELLSERHPLSDGLDLDLLAPERSGEDLPLEHIPVRVAKGLSGHAWEQLMLARRAPGGIVNLCNSAPLTRSKQIVCVHDANVFLCPESYSAQFRAAYRVLLPLVGRLAPQLATVSTFSAEQLARFGVAKRDKITVVPNGGEHASRWAARHSEATCSAAGPDTIVLLGSKAPHKNVGIVLGLADALAAAGLRIAVVGHVDGRVFASQGQGERPGNVVELGPISDAELAALLSDCLCLAFPSLTEGFGLPPLEAMTLGCPVVVSDRGSLPEVCGDAALYASPTDPEAWRSAFLRLRGDPSLRAELIQRGRSRSARFSWRTAAEEYLVMMARADGLM